MGVAACFLATLTLGDALPTAQRHVLVTGGNRGIGYALCKAIVAEHENTTVFLGARDLSRGEAAAQEISRCAPGRVHALRLDVTDEDSIAAAAKSTSEQLGGEKLYAIVCNAGILGGDCLRELVDVNVKGPQRVLRAFSPLLAADGGRVVIVSSMAGVEALRRCSDDRRRSLLAADLSEEALAAIMAEAIAAGDGASSEGASTVGDRLKTLGYFHEPSMLEAMNLYSLSKAFVLAWTRAFSRAQPGMRIQACCPGVADTDFARDLPHLSTAAKRKAVGVISTDTAARVPLRLLFTDDDVDSASGFAVAGRFFHRPRVYRVATDDGDGSVVVGTGDAGQEPPEDDRDVPLTEVDLDSLVPQPPR